MNVCIRNVCEWINCSFLSFCKTEFVVRHLGMNEKSIECVRFVMRTVKLITSLCMYFLFSYFVCLVHEYAPFPKLYWSVILFRNNWDAWRLDSCAAFYITSSFIFTACDKPFRWAWYPSQRQRGNVRKDMHFSDTAHSHKCNFNQK